jgi:hypothetical protein
MDLIKKQQVEGFWIINEDNCKLVNEKEQGIFKTIPKLLESLDESLKNNIWFTALVLAWIQKYFSKDKGSLQLIITKAKQWMKQQGVEYRTLLKDSNEYFDETK